MEKVYFRGYVEGQGATVQRTGSKKTGLMFKARLFNGLGIKIKMEHNAKEGNDSITIYKTEGNGTASYAEELISCLTSDAEV